MRGVFVVEAQEDLDRLHLLRLRQLVASDGGEDGGDGLRHHHDLLAVVGAGDLDALVRVGVEHPHDDLVVRGEPQAHPPLGVLAHFVEVARDALLETGEARRGTLELLVGHESGEHEQEGEVSDAVHVCAGSK